MKIRYHHKKVKKKIVLNVCWVLLLSALFVLCVIIVRLVLTDRLSFNPEQKTIVSDETDRVQVIESDEISDMTQSAPLKVLIHSKIISGVSDGIMDSELSVSETDSDTDISEIDSESDTETEETSDNTVMDLTDDSFLTAEEVSGPDIVLDDMQTVNVGDIYSFTISDEYTFASISSDLFSGFIDAGVQCRKTNGITMVVYKANVSEIFAEAGIPILESQIIDMSVYRMTGSASKQYGTYEWTIHKYVSDDDTTVSLTAFASIDDGVICVFHHCVNDAHAEADLVSILNSVRTY